MKPNDRMEAFNQLQRRLLIEAADLRDGKFQEHERRIKDETRGEFFKILSEDKAFSHLAHDRGH